MDPAGILQGHPGYSNEVVMPGDWIVCIETRPVNIVERMEWWAGSDMEMLDFLNGPEGSDVALVLRRKVDESEYQVVLKRHVPATAQEMNSASASFRSVQVPTHKTLFDAPPIPRSRLTAIGGVGVALRRLDGQNDTGPVLVHFVHEFAPVSGKIIPNDRLVSVNTERVDHLPMKTIHALVDGQDGTRLTLQFEHVVTTRKIANFVAFWKNEDRVPSDIISSESFELKRSNQLPLSKAVDDDDWSYRRANPTPADLTTQEGPSPADRNVGMFGFPSMGLVSQESPTEPVVGMLVVTVSKAKNLPTVGAIGPAGVFTRVTCADFCQDSDVVNEDTFSAVKRTSTVNPEWNMTFEIPIRKHQLGEILVVEVMHKQAFIADVPYGQLKLPKAAQFVGKKGLQIGWYSLVDSAGAPVQKGHGGSRPLVHLQVSWQEFATSQPTQGAGTSFYRD